MPEDKEMLDASVQKDAVDAGSATPQKKKSAAHIDRPLMPRKSSSRAVFWLMLIIVALGCGGWWGYKTYFAELTQSKETRIVCYVELDGFDAPNEVGLTHPFSTEIEDIQRRYKAAKIPLLKDQEEKDKVLVLAKARLQETEKKQSDTEVEYRELKGRMQAALEARREKTKGIWAGSAERFGGELAEKKAAFRQTIEARVKEMKIEWPEQFDVDEPDVIVSAFRLALYHLPKTVDKSKELAWAESQLGAWRNFEKDWHGRREELRKQAEENQSLIDPELSGLQARVDELNKEIVPLGEAVSKARAECSEAEAAHRISMSTTPEELFQQFQEELRSLPQKRTIAPAARLDDYRFIFSHLERHPEASSGNFMVFLRVSKNGEEHWGFEPVSIGEGREASIRFSSETLHKVKDLIDGAAVASQP